MALVTSQSLFSLPPVSLQGKLVRLESLVPEHEPELLQICGDERIWRYLTSYGGEPRAMRTYLAASLEDYRRGSALPFVIRAVSNQQVLGMTRLKDLSREHRKAVVGSWITPSAWGTGTNTEAKLLILEYAFETLGCIRIEFHTDSQNLRSRTALTRLGAAEEGTLRSCMIRRDGTRRDTVVFSVLEREWPSVKRTLSMRLDAQRGLRSPGIHAGSIISDEPPNSAKIG